MLTNVQDVLELCKNANKFPMNFEHATLVSSHRDRYEELSRDTERLFSDGGTSSLRFQELNHQAQPREAIITNKAQLCTHLHLVGGLKNLDPPCRLLSVGRCFGNRLHTKMSPDSSTLSEEALAKGCKPAMTC